MFAHLFRISQRLLRLTLLPSSCALCGQADQDTLCRPCRQHYFSPRPHRCVQCAMPIAATATALRCGSCVRSSPAFDATVVVADYAPPIDQLVLALKFHAKLTLTPLLAGLLREAWQCHADRGLPLPHLLTAVPLGHLRLQERGFNQSLEIARPLARLLAMRLDPHLLVRLRDTEAQATLSTTARKRNMRRAFVVPHGCLQQVRGRHIGVVDDVITTGETLNEVAATLKRFGALRVTNLVFARTVSH